MTFASSTTEERQSFPRLPAPEPGLDLGEPPDQLRRRLPILGGAGGEAEVAAQEGEEARVAEGAPEPLRVEVREGEEEVRHRALLAAEQVGEAGGEFARSVHTRTFSRVFAPS
jgi:hypothetical protein